MERKIGEIFEYDGEWYQCMESQDGSCKHCDMNFEGKCPIPIKECTESGRSDKSYVIFKKLEKVGEPYNIGKKVFQRYEVFIKPYIFNDEFFTVNTPVEDLYISIEIKHNKDMKTVRINKDDLNFLVNKIRYGILPKHIDYDKIINEISKLFSVDDTKHSNSENIGKNLKPFDLEAAKSGKPVCTRDGRKARIICFDSKNDPRRPIVALVEHNDNELLYEYTIEGKDCFSHISTTGTSDLMMLSEKKEGWEFAGCENGEVRIRKVEPELPTDFEKALGAVKVSEIRSMLVPSGMHGAVSALCKLLIYRNAWWQKLGWKPDWKEHDGKFVIRPNYDNVECSTNATANRILAFPTEEVRDKFAETFKDLIEEAKELL